MKEMQTKKKLIICSSKYIVFFCHKFSNGLSFAQNRLLIFENNISIIHAAEVAFILAFCFDKIELRFFKKSFLAYEKHYQIII